MLCETAHNVTLLVFCQPTGAADRCLDCSIETECPYSARKIYLDILKQVNILTHFLQLSSTIYRLNIML